MKTKYFSLLLDLIKVFLFISIVIIFIFKIGEEFSVFVLEIGWIMVGYLLFVIFLFKLNNKKEKIRFGIYFLEFGLIIWSFGYFCQNQIFNSIMFLWFMPLVFRYCLPSIFNYFSKKRNT